MTSYPYSDLPAIKNCCLKNLILISLIPMANHKAHYLTNDRTQTILRVPSPLWKRFKAQVKSTTFKSANEAVVAAIKAFIDCRGSCGK